jgi:hypothetical protein
LSGASGPIYILLMNTRYIPQNHSQRILASKHYSKVAGHFGRERTLKLIIRNFYCTNMKRNIWKYCCESDVCQGTKASRYAEYSLLHPLELAWKPGPDISTDFITDLSKSEGVTMILVVVDLFTKMAHFIPIKKKDAPTVARTYLKNVWKHHGFPEDIVSNRDSSFTGSIFTDLYYYLGIKHSMSTA